ncbi:MAG: M13 family metallopeptidase [Mucispirillum sp.]|nr:M13 family metallopeptidase [Mucispirillum sp.]
MNDFETRNKSGIGLLQNDIDKIDKAANINEFLKALFEVEKKYSLKSFMNIDVMVDYNDNNKYVYCSEVYTLISKEQFNDENQIYKNYLKTLLTKLFIINGKTEQEAVVIVENVLNMMHDIASVTLSADEATNPDKTYNVTNFTNYAAALNNVITVEELSSLYGVTGDTTLIVSEIDAFNKTIDYLKEENLELLKNYVKSAVYYATAQYTDMESLLAYNEYNNKINGILESKSIDEINNKIVNNIMKYELGRIYISQYFSDEIKNNIELMINNIKNIYKERINKLSWMSNDTKIKAVEKLDKMKYIVGVGENSVWPQDIFKYQLDKKSEGGLAINNFLKIKEAAHAYYLKEYENGSTVDKNILLDAPQVVNAYYDPVSNSINILPGIVQFPVYSKDMPLESNLGGIGSIIAHEITHAFDNQGALFDADGNYGTSWWQPEDYAKFQELTYKVVAYYDNYTINGVHVNGEQTLGENIADLGAMSCVTEYAKNKGYDLDKVYKSYAKNWAIKTTPEYSNLLLAVDAHSPNKVRVNAVISAMDDFYTLYDIKETDGMYKEPSIRPSIW